MSLTTPFIGGNLKPGTSAPVVVSSSAMPLNFVPLTLLNAPPTYTVFGVGPGSSALTWPSSVGAKPVSSAPVVASTASRSVLVTAVLDPDGVAEVKLPPTKTLLPTWAKAWTEPSPMFGVPAIGTVPTRLVCLRADGTGGVGPDGEHGHGGHADRRRRSRQGSDDALSEH